MFARFVKLCAAVLMASGVAASATLLTGAQAASPKAAENGVVAVKSAYPMAETIARLKKDIAAKGIMFFSEIDQAKLAAAAGVKLRPTTLLVFGNPPLGTQFVTANVQAGLDWPVRLLVAQDETGQVWTYYTDFIYIARRHGIADRDAQFNMASRVIASITASVAVK